MAKWSLGETLEVGCKKTGEWLMSSLGRELNSEILLGVFAAERSRQLAIDVKGGLPNESSLPEVVDESDRVQLAVVACHAALAKKICSVIDHVLESH